jgi:hypothetical protein
MSAAGEDWIAALQQLHTMAEGGGHADAAALTRVRALCNVLRLAGGMRDKIAGAEALFAVLYSPRKHETHPGGIVQLRVHLTADLWAIGDRLQGRADGIVE